MVNGHPSFGASQSNSNYGKIYQNKSFIEISDECKEIAETIEPQKFDRIEILTNYILSLEDDIPKEDYIHRNDLPIFRGNSLIGNGSQTNTRRMSFQKNKRRGTITFPYKRKLLQ